MNGDPNLIYRHTQPGRLMIFMLGIPLLIAAITAFMTGGSPISLFLLAVFGILLTLFHALTVEVDGEQLRWRFGIGLVGKSIPVDQVVDARAVTNRWFYGWGIRYTPHGWLFNVSGFEAVEIRLLNDRRYRVGTDEPMRLVAAIEQARNAPSAKPPASGRP